MSWWIVKFRNWYSRIGVEIRVLERLLQLMSVFIVGEYFFGVGEVSFWFPTIFSGGVSFPFDQVGVASAAPSVSNNSFNLVF